MPLSSPFLAVRVPKKARITSGIGQKQQMDRSDFFGVVNLPDPQNTVASAMPQDVAHQLIRCEQPTKKPGLGPGS
ncbi:hypothetical protein [Pseudochelatococcus contaminans]|uniref:Uncharacterized protein n=1 Tax=Pseudochelatococcus contaminans TaxID=1538103 RepID=A0A7W6EGK7_9HYPH|nr:hypothetical protein [Pseudochelatococcus contaminans]MBB3809539.1 hypothetical protein [Pseudochelatococcus contaminans]